MSDTTLTSGRRRALITLGALALTLLFVEHVTVPVTIDGWSARLGRGMTVGDVRRQSRLTGARGDLVSLSGRLLKARAGGVPVVSVNGRAVGDEAVLLPGARIVSSRGHDTVESLVPRTIETTPSIRYAGHGPVMSIEDSGTPGTIRVMVGRISGEEESRTRVSHGTPMTVRREPAWPGRKEVALTFDDGPWPGSTDAILRELRAANAKATFFMIGSQLSKRPEVGKRVVAAGMEVGDHSQRHRMLAHASPATITSEIQRGAQVITRVLGERPRWYRPAGGSTNAFVYREAKRLGLRVVLWTVDPKDWSRPGARKIARRVLDHVRPGSVILLHDGGGNRSQTIAALEIVLRGLKARGYSTVTLSRLYRLPEPAE